MMRALIVYCHPKPDSFTAAVRDVVLQTRLHEAGAETRLIDLYAQGFDAGADGGRSSTSIWTPAQPRGRRRSRADLEWCDTLIFVYPTWWYGLPAMLKGWLDRVLVPGAPS
jgi:NAD(P)H dehydrogenase (quinone)